MFSANLYNPYYHITVAILTFIVLSQYSSRTMLGKKRSNWLAFILAIAFSYIIGTRPVSNTYFVDMSNYAGMYENAFNDRFYFTWDTTNVIFDNLFLYLASKSVPVKDFFLLMASIYFLGIYFACRKAFPRDILLSFLCYLGAFSTFSYATNGIKAGAAASLFLIAFAYRDNLKIAIIFLALSLGFHHAMILPIAAFILTLFYQNRKFWLFIWIVCLLLAILHVTFFQQLFAGLTDEQGSSYLNTIGGDVSGLRIDFIIYSGIPIFLGYYLTKKFHIENKGYDFLWSVYTLTNAVYLLCTYASFTNRIAYLSWLMYPFILLYPVLNVNWGKHQYDYLNYVVLGHLAFTLFMVFIYY